MLIRTELNFAGFYSFTDSISGYNRLISAHGLGMVFLFIMPALISYVGNWTMPQSFESMDFILPRVNPMSAYMLIAASAIMICALSREEGVGAG